MFHHLTALTAIYLFIARHNVAIVIPDETTTKKRGEKRKFAASTTVKMSAKALRDFGIEYSVSSRAHCCGCRLKILKVYCGGDTFVL